MNDYHLFGWRLRSQLSLVELLPWRGDARAPDIIVEIGTVPELDPESPCFSPVLQIQPTGVRFIIPSVAGYWVEGGRRVVVSPTLPKEAPDIRVFLLGTVLAVLCFQRGLLPLHASAVDIGGQTLLLSGPSGAGKSTLAAAFSARGHRLLSDDLCALRIEKGESLMIHPAFPIVKLWRDSADHLQAPIDGLPRSREELEKYHVPLAEDRFQPAPLPVAQIVFLRTERLAEARRSRLLGGFEALRRYDLVHRWRLGLALGAHRLMFEGMARLVETASVAEVARSADLADLPSLVDEVLALMDAPGE
ncbi:MAG: HPr kinase/phosphorylase [Elsteraceae bacterium]